MRLRTFQLSMCLLLSAACQGGSFNGSGSTNNKSDDKPRPSEEGEGVVGYLTDANSVEFSEEGGKSTVRGPSGSVASNVGEVDGIEVCLQVATQSYIDGLLNDDLDALDEDVEVVVSGQVKADGSFELTYTADQVHQDGPIILNVSGFCQEISRRAFYRGSKAVAFKPPGSSDFLYAQEDDGSTDTDKDLESSICDAVGAEECDGSIQFEVVDAGSNLRIDGEFELDFQAIGCEVKSLDCTDLKEAGLAKGRNDLLTTYPSGDYIVTVSLEGYQSERVLLEAADSEKALEVKLKKN